MRTGRVARVRAGFGRAARAISLARSADERTAYERKVKSALANIRAALVLTPEGIGAANGRMSSLLLATTP
jgi:hypothetical protein